MKESVLPLLLLLLAAAVCNATSFSTRVGLSNTLEVFSNNVHIDVLFESSDTMEVPEVSIESASEIVVDVSRGYVFQILDPASSTKNPTGIPVAQVTIFSPSGWVYHHLSLIAPSYRLVEDERSEAALQALQINSLNVHRRSLDSILLEDDNSGCTGSTEPLDSFSGEADLRGPGTETTGEDVRLDYRQGQTEINDAGETRELKYVVGLERELPYNTGPGEFRSVVNGPMWNVTASGISRSRFEYLIPMSYLVALYSGANPVLGYRVGFSDVFPENGRHTLITFGLVTESGYCVSEVGDVPEGTLSVLLQDCDGTPTGLLLRVDVNRYRSQLELSNAVLGAIEVITEVCEALPGSSNNPIDVSAAVPMGSTSYTLELPDPGPIFFTFTPTETVVVSYSTCDSLGSDSSVCLSDMGEIMDFENVGCDGGAGNVFVRHEVTAGRSYPFSVQGGDDGSVEFTFGYYSEVMGDSCDAAILTNAVSGVPLGYQFLYVKRVAAFEEVWFSLGSSQTAVNLCRSTLDSAQFRIIADDTVELAERAIEATCLDPLESRNSQCLDSNLPADDFQADFVQVTGVTSSGLMVYDEFNGDTCFAAHSLVTVRGQGLVRMDMLQSGAVILGADGQWTQIVGWIHRHTAHTERFVELQHQDGVVTMTAEHFVFMWEDGERVTRTAAEVMVGDWMVGPTGQVVEVQAVGTRQHDGGIYTPLTTTGDLIVDGVLCSCYADAPNPLRFSDRVTHFWAQAYTAPMRWAPRIFGTIENLDTPGWTMFPCAGLREIGQNVLKLLSSVIV